MINVIIFCGIYNLIICVKLSYAIKSSKVESCQKLYKIAEFSHCCSP